MLLVRELVVGYKGMPAVHGISFNVQEGEIVAIVGANGAGKSTILRAISGLLKPVRGEIIFLGQNISQWPPHRIVAAGIAHVPEGRLTFARMTVEQNLALGAYTVSSGLQKEALRKEVYALFPRLHERRLQTAGTLSGGEQQMLAIARGLMSAPKLMLLDEPSLGLMPKLVDQIFDFVRQIKEKGKTILLVEQNVREALELADRGYVLQTGRIVAEGTGKELLESDLVRRAYLGI
ncbi:MAG: ABC transporter ATP-binding protein [Firmicutes bacterium]|nr:ABC transporter ATP-binding protein [Bacillota bacterium]